MYKQFAAGYLVHDNKVLLIHNKAYDKWTPPGGHMEGDETPDQTVIREVLEEVGLHAEVIAASSIDFKGDDNATPIPMPFYMDLEREGFDTPRIGFFFFIKTSDNVKNINLEKNEAHSFAWFSEDQLDTLKTYDQVKALARYALKNYPK